MGTREEGTGIERIGEEEGLLEKGGGGRGEVGLLEKVARRRGRGIVGKGWRGGGEEGLLEKGGEGRMERGRRRGNK